MLCKVWNVNRSKKAFVVIDNESTNKCTKLIAAGNL